MNACVRTATLPLQRTIYVYDTRNECDATTRDDEPHHRIAASLHARDVRPVDRVRSARERKRESPRPHTRVRLLLFEKDGFEFEENFRERIRRAFRNDFFDDRFSQRNNIQRL